MGDGRDLVELDRGGGALQRVEAAEEGRARVVIQCAGGRLDAFVDCSPNAHGSWDYLGGMLICEEAGAAVVDAWDRGLVTLEHTARRTPIAAATPELLARAVTARRRFAEHDAWSSERPLA